MKAAVTQESNVDGEALGFALAQSGMIEIPFWLVVPAVYVYIGPP